MIVGGLSISAWLLLVLAVGIGLIIELRFFLRHRRDAAPDGEDR